MTRKWTKGPWHWRNDVNTGEFNLSPGIFITDYPDGTPWGDEIDRANAALIAAAPEMAGALAWYYDQMCEGFCRDLSPAGAYLEEMDDECAGCKARAILAKARGES